MSTSVSSFDQNDCDHDSLSVVKIFTTEDLEAYLKETMEVCQTSNFALTLNEKHRKSMLRAIVGITKSEYKKGLKELQLQQQWKLADDFIRNDLVGLMNISELQDKAPKFASGVQQYLDNKDLFTNRDPYKFFSSLAGGREHQGNMIRLLEDLQPDLLPTFHRILDDIPESELMRLFVEDKCEKCDETTSHLLQKCLDMTFAQPPPQPIDGGRSKGKRGEVDLITYLGRRYSNALYAHKSCQILSPVWVRERNPAKTKMVAKQHYVLEVPTDTMKDGMTNEFDAMVVSSEFDAKYNSQCIIEEVWDAKATMDPVAMYDILHKKVSTLEYILHPEILMDTKFLIRRDDDAQQQSYDVVAMPASSNDNARLLPQIGLFGSRFPSPQGAAQSVQVTICEHLLGKDRGYVEQILLEEPSKGQVSPPRDFVVDHLKILMELVRSIHPILVAPVSTS